MKNMKLTNVLIKIGTCFILSFVVILMCLSAYSTCYVTLNLNTMHYYLGDSILFNIVVGIAVIGLFIIVEKLKPIIGLKAKINENDKLYKKILFAGIIAIFLLSLYFVLFSKVCGAVDSFWIQEAVSKLRHGNMEPFTDSGYIGMCLNQVGFFLYSYLLSFIFGEQNYLALEILNCFYLAFSYYLIADISKLNGSSNYISLVVVLLGILFFPLIMYTTFVYGNIVGLMFSLLGARYTILFIKNNKNKDLFLSIIYSSLAILLKQNYIITEIAIIIVVIFSNIKAFSKISYLLCSVVIILLINTMPLSYLRFKTNEPLEKGIPSISYVAMGLQTGGHRAPGWYNNYNWDVYTNNNHDSKIAALESMNEIKNRVNYFKEHKGYTISFFTLKLASEWNDPSFEAFALNQVMMYWTEHKNDSFIKYLGNEYYINAVKYLNPFIFLVYFGTALYLLSLLSKNNINISELILLIIFAGGFIFHIFWEAKAQYTITYFVLLFPSAILGFDWIIKLITKGRTINSKNTFIIGLSVIAAVVLIFYILHNRYMLTSLISDADEYWRYVANSYANTTNIYYK